MGNHPSNNLLYTIINKINIIYVRVYLVVVCVCVCEGWRATNYLMYLINNNHKVLNHNNNTYYIMSKLSEINVFIMNNDNYNT